MPERIGKKPRPASRAKSVVTRVQNSDYFAEARFMQRARELLLESELRATDEELEAFLVGAGGAGALARSVLDALRSGIDPAVVCELRLGLAVTDGDATYRFTIVSDVDQSGAQLVDGDADAQLTMGIAGLDLLRLAIGQLEPIEAVMNGRITLTGNLELVAKLAQVFAAGPALAVS